MIYNINGWQAGITATLCLPGMESFGEESDWDGMALSVTTRRNNLSLSSLLVTGLNSINSSHSGGSYFGIFPENGSTATPHTLSQPQVRDLNLARAEIAVLSLVLALTTLGNSFVLWVLLRRRKYNAPMHVFMVNLCVADLVVAFFQVSSRVRSLGRTRLKSWSHWCHSSAWFPQISKLTADSLWLEIVFAAGVAAAAAAASVFRPNLKYTRLMSVALTPITMVWLIGVF